MKIKILKCSKSAYWYNDSIGNIYYTSDPFKLYDVMRIKVDGHGTARYIDFSDCEILSVPQHETPKVGTNKQTKEVCGNCRDGFWLRKNTKCLICGKVQLDDS